MTNNRIGTAITGEILRWLFLCQTEEVTVMPKKLKCPCSYPGCPKMTDGRYCEEHEKLEAKRYEKYDRAPASRHRYRRAWKRIHDNYAAAYLLCEES